MDVMVIGNVTVDHVLTLDAPPPCGDKAYASARCSCDTQAIALEVSVALAA